jgi:hypothetical protein
LKLDDGRPGPSAIHTHSTPASKSDIVRMHEIC